MADKGKHKKMFKKLKKEKAKFLKVHNEVDKTTERVLIEESNSSLKNNEESKQSIDYLITAKAKQSNTTPSSLE